MKSHIETRRFARQTGTLAILILTSAMLFCLGCGDDDDPVSSATGDTVDEYQLPMTRTSWHPASEPYPYYDENPVRGRLLWHTPRERQPVADIYEADSTSNEIIQTFRMIFRPVEQSTPPTESWAGITTCFDKSIPDEKSYFQIRLRGTHGHMHFDFGRISEDLNGDGFAYTEDLNGNGVVEEDEDVGLDGLSDGEEPFTVWGNSADPAGDNWFFQGEGKCPIPDGCSNVDWDSDEFYYEYLNGTEGNRLDQSVMGLPDRECPDVNRTMMKDNAYFSFDLYLANDIYLVRNSEFNGWRTYLIPVRDSAVVDIVSQDTTSADWQEIRHVRVWFESDGYQTSPDTVEIAEWGFAPVDE